ncbi:probable r3H domain-containing protein 2 at N-terminal half [Coccomyxa sp. Obi]|nr:probable r3H domain-containing protein 2 at N-terminal half [Coccomyxa sp. Obi]
MGDDEPAEQVDPVRLESLKVSTSGGEPLVPAAARQDVPHGRIGQGGSRDIRRAGAQDKAGHGLGHSSLLRAYPRQAEAAGQIDEALQDALSNPKHRMLVLRLEDEVRDFVQSTRSTLLYGQSLNGFQRLLAHRVSYFYGLETCKVEEGAHQGKILASKTSWTRLPLVKLADSVRVVERSSGGADASRIFNKKKSAGSRGSNDSDSGKGMATSTSREGTALSEAAGLEGLQRPKVQSHEGRKGDRELAEAAAPGVGPLGLQIRPLSERQRDIERAKARTFSDNVPVPQHRHACGSHHISNSSPGWGGLLEKSLERGSETASRRSPASEGGHAGRGQGSKKAALRIQKDPNVGWTCVRTSDECLSMSLPQLPSGDLAAMHSPFQRSLSSEFQQLGVGAAAAKQLPLLSAAQAQRAGQQLSDSESHSGSAQSTRSPRGVQPPPQVMVPMQPDLAPSHFLPAGNVAQLPAYGQPVQIPPGYAFVPAQPQMPGMPVFGQGHLVPIGNIAMQPQQPYGYIAAGAAVPVQGMEGTPLPIMPMAVAPQPAHMQQQGALPMYADYHTAGSPQGFGVPMHAVLPGMQQAHYQPQVQQSPVQQMQMQHSQMQPSQKRQPQMQQMSMYPSSMKQPPMQLQSTPRRHLQMQQSPMMQPKMQQMQGQHTPRQQPLPMQQPSMQQAQMQHPGPPLHTPQHTPARAPTTRPHIRRGGGNQPKTQNRLSGSSQLQASPDAQRSRQQPQHQDQS